MICHIYFVPLDLRAKCLWRFLMLCMRIVKFLDALSGCNVRSVVRMCYADRTQIHCIWSSSAQGRMRLMSFTFTREVWTHGFVDVLICSQKGKVTGTSKMWLLPRQLLSISEDSRMYIMTSSMWLMLAMSQTDIIMIPKSGKYTSNISNSFPKF
jgi:hypothetical protein